MPDMAIPRPLLDPEYEPDFKSFEEPDDEDEFCDVCEMPVADCVCEEFEEPGNGDELADIGKSE